MESDFPDIIKALILGIVEGITEFLPISSTGHLIIVNEFLSFGKRFTNVFDVVIQLGAILSVLVYFRRSLSPFHKEGRERAAVLAIGKKTIVGVLPALLFGALLGSVVEEKLFHPPVVALALILGGILLIIIEKKAMLTRIHSLKDLSYSAVLVIGCFQCLALIPGTSRSAATIIGAMLLGASRQVAAEYSFFLAIPTIAAASLYALLKSGLVMSEHEIIILLIGFATASLTAFAVIAAFMKFIQTKNFTWFGYYRIALGLAVLAYFFAR